MDGSQHSGVFLSMTICIWFIRFVTTFCVDSICVATPFTITVDEVMGLTLLVVFITCTWYR